MIEWGSVGAEHLVVCDLRNELNFRHLHQINTFEMQIRKATFSKVSRLSIRDQDDAHRARLSAGQSDHQQNAIIWHQIL